ncbi:MAG: hypothetical protein Q8L86_08380 [Vicinamibacterales bacterium]|nr:hypothetical protein [Vicinamibacterales bacterium]
MTRRIVGALLSVSFALVMAGCGAPPTERVDAAKARVEALSAEAAVYATEAHARAREAVAALDAELAAQADSFMKSYDRTDTLVAAVESSADALEQAIEAGKTRLGNETDSLIASAGRTLTEARAALDGLPATALRGEQATAWRADLDAAEASMDEASRLRTAGQLADARQEARTAQESATRVRTEVGTIEAERDAAQQAVAERMAQGDVTLSRSVVADGKPLAAGTYRLRLADEGPAGDGTTRPGRWVEFVRGGKVAGRALAVVVPESEMAEIAASSSPRNEAWVADLQGGEYVRVWLHRGGVHYLMHLPPG